MRPAAAVALLLGALGTGEAAVPEGTPLLIALPPNALAADVGANGFVVLGSFFEGGAFYWMPTAGTQELGGKQGVALSRDGTRIVGVDVDERGFSNAAIWQDGTQWRRLGSIAPDAQPCDLLLSSAFGASDDAGVVVGLAWNGCSVARAFRWEESTGMVDLGSLSGESTRANNVSGDGRVVVGWEQDATGPRHGAKWVDGREQLIRGPTGPVGEAFAANRDGSLIVGATCDFTDTIGPPSAWTWTERDGVRCFPVRRPADLPPLPYRTVMFTTSDDGRVIGGAFTFGLDSEALVWFDGQPFFLKDYLRQNGVADAFEGWVNTGFILGMTRDGRTLVGYGAGPRAFQGYMVVLPELGSE